MRQSTSSFCSCQDIKSGDTQWSGIAESIKCRCEAKVWETAIVINSRSYVCWNNRHCGYFHDIFDYFVVVISDRVQKIFWRKGKELKCSKLRKNNEFRPLNNRTADWRELKRVPDERTGRNWDKKLSFKIVFVEQR